MDAPIKLWHEHAKHLGTVGMAAFGALAAFVYNDAKQSYWIGLISGVALLASIFLGVMYSSLLVVCPTTASWEKIPRGVRCLYWACVWSLVLGGAFFAAFAVANYREGP